MEYENYPKRIKPLFHFKSFKKPKADMKEVVYISAKKRRNDNSQDNKD